MSTSKVGANGSSSFDYSNFNQSVADNFGGSMTTDDNDTTGASQKKGGAKGSASAKAGAGKASATDAGAAGTAGTAGATTGASTAGSAGAAASSVTGQSAGGSLGTGADVAGTTNKAATDDTTQLATDVGTSASDDAQPTSLDSDANVAAAQKQLAKLEADPNSTNEQIDAQVKKLVDLLDASGRSADALNVLGNAMPASSSQGDLASVYALAAQYGVSLDSGKSAEDTANDVKVSQAQKAKQQAALQQAQQQAAAEAAKAAEAQKYAQQYASSGGSSGSGSSSGSSGTSKANDYSGSNSWDGKTVSASTSTSDTSSKGGSKLSYSGPASNFPNDTSKWASWDDLWSKASGEMASSDTSEQIGWIKDGIEKEAAATGIDKRFILAVVMQESSGNVHVGATNNGVNNPGLMQSHDGASFDGTEASVLQMIKDGVEGTSSGDGLVQGVKSTGNLFAAARLYNSGQMNSSNLSDAMGATASYCSDLANFVMGRS